MSCPACGTPTLSFVVPPKLREHAPGSDAHAAICPGCLRTHAGDTDTDAGADPDFSAIHPAVPSGEAGAAFALALGHLGSLALRRDAVDECCDHAERAGADVLLALDRLAVADEIDAHVDIDRRRHQLADFRR
jgi:hypothetical protein